MENKQTGWLNDNQLYKAYELANGEQIMVQDAILLVLLYIKFHTNWFPPKGAGLSNSPNEIEKLEKMCTDATNFFILHKEKFNPGMRVNSGFTFTFG